MPEKSPVYLNLWRIHLPLPGWISIIQRLSGAALFLLLPFMLFLFHLSFTPAGYIQLLQWRQLFFVKLVLAGVLWVYLQHFLAGIRFLLLDLQFGSSLTWARRLSVLTLGLSLLLTLIIIWMWW